MKKKILGICGTNKKNGFSSSEYLLKEALDAAEELGAETKLIRLSQYNILTCKGCGNCLDHKKCILLDDPNDELAVIYEACKEADAFIFSAPVYALGYPSIIKNWLDRCGSCSTQDLQDQAFDYDQGQNVKGKVFRGKVVSQIAVAAGAGHETAMASLAPTFTAFKLSNIMNVGISLIEYDPQPGVSKQIWSKRMEEATFAVNIAREVGKRTFETIGYTTFFINDNSKLFSSNNRREEYINTVRHISELEVINGKPVNDEKKIILIIVPQQQSKNAIKCYDYLFGKYNTEYEIYIVALVEKRPDFITKQQISSQLEHIIMDRSFMVDWDLNFAMATGHEINTITICIVDRVDETIERIEQNIKSI